MYHGQSVDLCVDANTNTATGVGGGQFWSADAGWLPASPQLPRPGSHEER